MKIVLASTSKFKSDILSRVHIKHECMSIDYEENSSESNYIEYVKDLALGKAMCLKDKVDGIIIGIDNVVVCDDEIIEKPESIEEARSNLVKASNNVSKVVSGLAIIDTINNKVINTYQETLVYMNEISEEDINYYIDNEEGVMYAAGFIIENIASNFINKIEGSYYNILGVPVEKIYEILKDMGYSLKDINSD